MYTIKKGKFIKRFSIFLAILLILGCIFIIPNDIKALNYTIDSNLSDVDASFIGENINDLSGYSVDIAGDVNGDGYDDIIIGAYGEGKGGKLAGKTYIIFGKTSGWSKNIDLSNADASFIGENSSDQSGLAVAGAGDVNGDGYDDILIGAYNNDEGGSNAGQTYLIFGKLTGWTLDYNLANANASFIGEKVNDWSGFSLAGAGDVNGDSYDDILIGAFLNDEGGGNPNNFPDGAGQTYLVFGKATGWSLDTLLSNSNASFIGESNPDHSGASLAGAGDVNGDGYDDILIGADGNGESFPTAGQTYLIFGNTTGWSMDMDLSNSDASFLGENQDGFSGDAVCGAGDVNGDGYDDILIGALGNNESGHWAGQSYLIFGKKSGWSMDVNLSNANASFFGEAPNDWSGHSVASAGDVNGDGYDDILIGADLNDEGGSAAGQTYLILGKSSGWSMDINLSKANASFIGENSDDYSGVSIAGGGDINGDGYDDILIGAKWNDDGGHRAGKTYLIFPYYHSKPKSITSVKTYFSENYSIEISNAKMNDSVFVELIGIDGNGSNCDIAIVLVTSDISSPSAKGLRLKLKETGLNTGQYRGNFTLKDKKDKKNRWLNTSIGEIITITSIQDPTKFITLSVGYLKLFPLEDNIIAQEDFLYNEYYYTNDWPNVNWLFETNASWLNWSSTTHNISGIPNNSEVGQFWVRINITRGPNLFDEHNFTLTVYNNPPDIIIENIPIAIEDIMYISDYRCDDDGQGTITWYLDTNATWLNINTSTGNLNGIPSNADVGNYWVNVTVNDGNDGYNFTNFSLNVININDVPTIDTDDILIATEDAYYEINYTATDIDLGSVLEWSFNSNADWLSWGTSNHTLYGTPSNLDVGTYWVRINVSDSEGGFDEHLFNLTVININDVPIINTDNIIIATEDVYYEIMYTATDIDQGSILEWIFNTNANWLSWGASNHTLYGTPSNFDVGTHWVRINVSDGEGGFDEHFFNITVVNVNDPPGPAIIITPKENLTIQNGTAINFSANCNDPDLIYGDKLTFKWKSNLSNEIGIGDNLTNIILSPGNHTITLNVSDLIGESSKATVNITVLPDIIPNVTEPETPDNDTNPEKRKGDSKDSSIWIIIVIVIIIMIVIVIILFMILRKKKSQKNGDKKDDTQKETQQQLLQINQSQSNNNTKTQDPDTPP